MTFSRRSFMQLRGLGTTSFALPLFGSDDSPSGLVIPGNRSLNRHYVVYRKARLIEPVKDVTTKIPGARVVGKLVRKHIPGTGEFSEALPDPPMYMHIDPHLEDGMDPHVAFYRAAMRMRKQFHQVSIDRLLDLPEEVRPTATLVTVAYSAIYAAPVEMFTPASEERTGFHVYTEYHQVVRYGIVDCTGFNVYSEHGEYPIDIPSDLDLALLMRLDKQILTDPRMLHRPANSWKV